MDNDEHRGPASAFESPTFGQDASFRLEKPVGSASISPCGRDVVLASRQGLHIIDLDSPWSPPRYLAYNTPWEVADVQWSPFAARDYWVVSTSNQKALVWNLNISNSEASVEHVLHAHTRAITDINFSAHHPDILATCSVDSFVYCWDIRHPSKPALAFCDWFAGATQVKWNRQNPHILASSHDKFLRIWDDRKGAHPLVSIKAHATKIYGVDWNRLESTRVVTCSLDKTIKLWDYTKTTEEPESTICTPYPIWRARHAPFGHGLLAMPQRGDNNLYLYDWRIDEETPKVRSPLPVHSFAGHNEEVKEFLWRTRGNVTETVDDRDFQLVSWSADRTLRLHRVERDVSEDVGYQKGMEVRRTIAFTRKGALYKTFRDEPFAEDAHRSHPYMALSYTTGSGMSLGAPGDDGFLPPFIGAKQNSSSGFNGENDTKNSKNVDPITWMRGVRIGKRSNMPVDLNESVSTVLSPSLKTESGWERFESLGEELTHLGERFPKITFNEVDVSHRRLILSLSGPWDSQKGPLYIKVKLEFPKEYPKLAIPQFQIERTSALSEETVQQVMEDVASISTKYLESERSSTEILVRYLIGEQSLDECLRSLQRHRRSQDLIPPVEQDLSSSDDEDDDGLGPYAGVRRIRNADLAVLAINATHNVPLPKACGAIWSATGVLVCFFPAKQKEPSLLDSNLGSVERNAKNRSLIFEGFGQLQNKWIGKWGNRSTIATTDEGESDEDAYSTSSSESSMSSNPAFPHHYFLPAMGWQGDSLDPYLKLSVDGSQKSGGDMATGYSVASKTSMFVSLHDCSDMLPAKEELALRYKIDTGHLAAAHNAEIARDLGFPGLAETWTLIHHILRDGDALDASRLLRKDVSVANFGHQQIPPLRDRDSAIDLTYDAKRTEAAPASQNIVRSGRTSLGMAWMVGALFQHFEEAGNIQMLAMMSCVFSQSPDTKKDRQDHAGGHEVSRAYSDRIASRNASTDIALTLSGLTAQNFRKMAGGSHSANSSALTSMIDQSALSSESNTPPSHAPLRQIGERWNSQGTSLSTYPEFNRQMHRSASSFSGLASSFSRPFSLSHSVASSPPSNTRKRVSPSGSYLGITPANISLAPAHSLSRTSTMQEDVRGSFSLSVSDTEDDGRANSSKKSSFATTLKDRATVFCKGEVRSSRTDTDREILYATYRESYAQLLDAWQLPIQRCELLKFNSKRNTGHSGAASQALLNGRLRKLSNVFSIDGQDHDLRFASVCAKCSNQFSATKRGARCPSCRSPQPPPTCALCHQYIRGLSSPCPRCLHVLHARCRSSLQQTDSPLPYMHGCPTGCGCLCDDLLHFNISSSLTSPAVPLVNSNENFSSATYVAASRDASPALTLIADKDGRSIDQSDLPNSSLASDTSTTGGTSTQKGANAASGNLDPAYESLARNLRVGSGAAVAAGLGFGAGLREKGSQIWRGNG